MLRTSVASGTRAGLVTAIGLNASSACYGLLSAIGLPALARAWPASLVILRYAGAAYLLWIGASAIGRAIHRLKDPEPEGLPQRTRKVDIRSSKLIGEGFVVNTLNPPIAAFYLLVVPQFVPAGAPLLRSMLLLTAVHVSMAASWHAAWAIAGGSLAAALGGGRPRAALELTTGIALGAVAIVLVF